MKSDNKLLAFTGGRTQKAIQGSATQKPTYAQNLIAGKIGVGKRRGSHLNFTLSYAWDDENSISPDSVLYVTPQENYLLSTEAKLFPR